jgi:putative hydrolase of the HAD superfamily
MEYTTIFFDLDDTLYDSRTGLWDEIRKRMSSYMQELLGLPWDEIGELRQKYYQAYGTTLRGLQRHHQVDAEEFLAYVHDIPLDQYLEPNPNVRNLLKELPQKKWVFTNADANHASRVLARLELMDCFDGIVDLRAMQFACKPERTAYERALVLAGNPLPEACIMLDDALVNLEAANDIGFTTIWVTQNGDHNSVAKHTISNILQLCEVVPELCQANK